MAVTEHYEKSIIKTLLENQTKFEKKQITYTIYGEKEIESRWRDVTYPLMQKLLKKKFVPSKSTCYVDFDYYEKKCYTIYGEKRKQN